MRPGTEKELATRRRRFACGASTSAAVLAAHLLTVLLLAPSPAASKAPAFSRLLLQTSGPSISLPRLPLPSYADLQREREERLESMWNARGSLRATLGNRDLMSISAEVNPGLVLTMNQDRGFIEVETGTEMFTEGETSIHLVITRGEEGWLLSRGRIRLDGKDYFVTNGEVSVIELDEARGIFRATFSFTGRSEGRNASDLRVSNGSVSLRLVR